MRQSPDAMVSSLKRAQSKTLEQNISFIKHSDTLNEMSMSAGDLVNQSTIRGLINFEDDSRTPKVLNESSTPKEIRTTKDPELKAQSKPGLKNADK